VKVTAQGLRFIDASRRMERCLQEFRVRGVKTNLPFLINLMTHKGFIQGGTTTRFLDETPELFQVSTRQDRASKLLTYLAKIIATGHPETAGKKPPESKGFPAVYLKDDSAAREAAAAALALSPRQPPHGSRNAFQDLGPERFGRWI